ncbi:acyl carrier protein [Brevibacillus borstelensis]|uniref:acyl carrier protein n=1 Tax=Brevibacillus borstelensis TaxID=45462 RepID=UPI002E1B6301|nr:acyl carrier protein [Brevibacillus borstelensis]
MNNEQQYRNAFIECFNLADSEAIDHLVYNTIPEWDSIGHMQLVATLEAVFDIMIDTDDIIDLSSYEKGKEILSKYGIQF